MGYATIPSFNTDPILYPTYPSFLFPGHLSCPSIFIEIRIYLLLKWFMEREHNISRATHQPAWQFRHRKPRLQFNQNSRDSLNPHLIFFCHTNLCPGRSSGYCGTRARSAHSRSLASPPTPSQSQPNPNQLTSFSLGRLNC